MIQKVEVVSGCISCRNCENVCPSIFHVAPKSSVISHNYEGKESEILQAELMCPVNVIKVQKQGSFILSFKKAILQKKHFLTPDVLELTFETPDFSAKAGQYISLQMQDAYGRFSRSYSLAESSSSHFVLTVKILKKGRGSWFLRKFKPGKEISFLGALGNFVVQDTTKRKVCIATGTGLAPIIAILENTPAEVPKLVIFGARFEQDLYYLEKLQNYPNTQVIIKVSRPHAEHLDKKGRVTDELQHVTQEDEVYICGNPDMVEEVKKQLSERGTTSPKIYSESFTLSHVYPGFWRYLFVQGNIPYLSKISWGISLLWLFVVPVLWFYMQAQDNLYGTLGPIENFMWFFYDVSWYSVVFVMGIRPLSDIFPKIKIFKKLCYFRKAFGILSASIIVVNWLGMWYFNPAKIEQYFLGTRWAVWLALTARLSELTALILLLTSNNFSQRFLGIWWKRIQRLSYVYFITGGIVAAQFLPYKIYPLMFFVGILYFLAFLKNRKK